MDKRRSSRVKESEALVADNLRLLLESTDQGIYGIDMGAKCTLINRAGAKMVGYEPEEILGKNIHELIHHSRPDGSPYPVDECPVVRAVRSGQGVRVDDEVFWRRDRTSFPVEYSSYPIVERGVIKGAVVTFFDITERRQMEEALRVAHYELEMRVRERTEELERVNEELGDEIAKRERVERDRERLLQEYKTILRTAMDGYWLSDTQGHLLEVNDAYCRLIGYSRDELLKTRVQDIEAVERPQDTARHIQRVRQFGSDRFETRHRRKDGRIVDVEVSVNYLADGTERLFVFLRDITDRKRAEKEREQMIAQLREANEYVTATSLRLKEQSKLVQRRAAELEAVLDNMVDGVFATDAEGRIILVNEAGVRLTGIASAEEAAHWLVDYPERLGFRHPDGRSVASDEVPLARALKGETVVLDDQIIVNQKTLQDIYVRTNAAPIRDAEGKIVGAVAVVSDVTALMELEQLKDQFIEVAAHELKTPVTGIKGYTQFLIQREHEGVSDRGLKILASISRQADRISRLVNDLLDISRFRFAQLELAAEVLNLAELAQEVVDRAELTATKHRIRMVKAEPAVVEGDRSRLEQVLANLIDNAIKYSPKGGDIDVEIATNSHEAIASVRDYGIGIPKKKQAHIFERFYRAHTGTPYDYGGMGVGLYISHEIIKRHGGRMWFESEEGKGSTFSFSLPLALMGN